MQDLKYICHILHQLPLLFSRIRLQPVCLFLVEKLFHIFSHLGHLSVSLLFLGFAFDLPLLVHWPVIYP